MSISYKQLCKDTNEIIQKSKKRYNDNYEMVIETRKQLAMYYAANCKNIDRSILLKKHKALTSDSDVLNSNMVGIMFALIGSAMYECLDINIDLSDSKIVAIFQFIIILFIVTLMLIAIAFLTIITLRYVSNHIYGYERVYIDTFHSDLIDKLLFSEKPKIPIQAEQTQKNKRALKG